MIVGIECTAHTFSVALVRNGKILSNVRDMYKPKKGGIIPMESAKHHEKVAQLVWEKAIKEAKIREEKIEAIAVSNAPGLSPCLLAGLQVAKEKARKIGVPLIPVNHCIAHLEIGRHEGAKDPVLLYASGANTQIIAYEAQKYRVFGETLDSGIGNFIDTFARHAGIAFPGGPEIEKLANKYVAKPATASPSQPRKLIELPYSIKGMDVSFSGMQTKLKQLYDKARNKKQALPELAYAMQEHAFAMLVEAAERALAHTGKKELVLGGGVACNKRLQEMCRIMCKERGAKYFCPKPEFLVDNAAMIAFTGEMMFKATTFFRKESSRSQRNYKRIQKNYNGKNKSKKVVNVKSGEIGINVKSGRVGANKKNTGDRKLSKGCDNKAVFVGEDIDNLDIAPRERTDDVEVYWR